MSPPSTNRPAETADQTAAYAPAGRADGGPTVTRDYVAGAESTAGNTAPETLPSVPEAVAAVFGDRYELESQLGQGGFGTVIKALDRRLNRRVALKVTHSRLADPEQLLREARSLAQLRHPGIVSVFDVAVLGGHCFVVSELLAGPNLAEWLTAQLPPPGEAVRVAALIADALAHAHTRSIVHRDVKPSNVVFADDRRPVLVDFGLALSDVDAAAELGKVAGTPAYMSPEQVEGKAHRTDGRTDVYGLAVTLYTLLCGRAPFRGRTKQEVMRQVIEDEPQPLRQLRPEISVDVERVCLRGMAKKPADRYTTAADFADALRASVGPTPAALVAPLPPPPPRSGSVASPKTPRTERRQVTLLQTACEWPADAEDDPTERLAAFQSACAEVTKAHGGLPLQTAGGSFVACFGYPVAREDAPRQAIRAALGIGQKVGATAVVSAVNSGAAVVTDAANAPPVVVGEVMTAVSAVVSQTRQPGVVVTEATRRLVEGYFECVPAGEVQLRGATGTVPVYHLG